ncbi:MAG: enoyl-CoA hydratase/isomerase family protein [Promethearchaeota archaeon]
MDEPHVVIKKKGKICTIQLNRPEKANSLTLDMLEFLKSSLIDVQLDDKIRVVILTGAGKDFTTGMDTSTVKDLEPSKVPLLAAKMERLGAETARILMNGKTSICAVNGRTMGMGVVFALASDFRYAVENATFKMPEIDSSIYPAANCITLMTQQIGILKTKEILMTCNTYTAKQFKDLGILNDMLPNDGFLDEITKIAKVLSRKNPHLLRTLKININHTLFLKSFTDATNLEHDAFACAIAKEREKEIEKLVEKYNIDPYCLKKKLMKLKKNKVSV